MEVGAQGGIGSSPYYSINALLTCWSDLALCLGLSFTDVESALWLPSLVHLAVHQISQLPSYMLIS